MLHVEAGASGISGQGTTFCIPRVCATGSDVRNSVLVLDSVVDDVARIVDTRDNLRQ